MTRKKVGTCSTQMKNFSSNIFYPLLVESKDGQSKDMEIDYTQLSIAFYLFIYFGNTGD
jgi:hypothetical protein